MGDEIFSVYLTPADYSKLAYAKLDLPASPWKLLDAMDKVRLPEGDSLYLEITDYRDFEVLRSSLVCSATNLLELNDLAERLSRLNEVQRIAFEGLVRVDFQKQESITLKRLRDLAESVDCCHVVESVVSDGQLGRFYAENGFVPEVEGMSDAAFELLDFEKVGKMARMGECGVYVPSGISGLGGYVVQHSDLKSAPEITLNQPVEPAYTIHLRLTAHHDNLPFAGTDVVDLKLPAEDNALEMAVRCLGYLRNEDIQTAVEENLEYLNPPVKNAFAEFLTRIKLVDPDVDAALRDLSTKIDNAVFREWVAALLTCRYDRGMKTTLTPIVAKLSDMRIVNGDLENMVFEPRKEFIVMQILVLGNIPLLYFLNQEWYDILMHTPMGQIILAVCAAVLFVSTAAVIKLTQPIEYKR